MNDFIRDANQEENRFIIKRSGTQVVYEPIKIQRAIEKANAEEYREELKLSKDEIDSIVNGISKEVYRSPRAFSVEEIQEKVLEGIFYARKKTVYDLYRDYRNKHAERRTKSELDKKIEGIVEVISEKSGQVSIKNEEVKQENSNKNPTVLSVQRDYMAGEWSRHYTDKYLLPEDITKAHKEGIIHFHDSDYFSQKMHNCDLVNLEDMLQNGTCISGTKIDTPKSFITACTVASQIVAQVASSQYGGQTITMSHLAPFVDVSRQKIRKRLGQELREAEVRIADEKFDELVEKEVRKEVENGCQTIQYQLITLQSTNG